MIGIRAAATAASDQQERCRVTDEDQDRREHLEEAVPSGPERFADRHLGIGFGGTTALAAGSGLRVSCTRRVANDTRSESARFIA